MNIEEKEMLVWELVYLSLCIIKLLYFSSDLFILDFFPFLVPFYQVQNIPLSLLNGNYEYLPVVNRKY